MQRIIFSKQLKFLISQTGVRQNVLASRCGMSSASLSQILNGSALPSQKSLCRLLELLEVPLNIVSKLQYQLVLLNAIPRNLSPSEANIGWYFTRCLRGLTLPQMSMRTGLSIMELLDLESNPASGSEYSTDVFTRAFGYPPENIPNDYSSDICMVAENSGFGMPVITLFEMRKYTAGTDISMFAEENLCDFTLSAPAGLKNPAAIRCDAETIGLPFRGVVQLTVANHHLPGFEKTELVRYINGSFALIQDTQKPKFETVWEVPVLEFSFKPIITEEKYK